MWTIRQEQMNAFKQAALQRFEERMVEHLKQFAPDHWRSRSEAAGRSAIRTGIELARGYGITTEQGVCFFIDLAFIFGDGFDRHLQWVARILRDSRIQTESERLGWLRREAALHEGEIVTPPGGLSTHN
jgi:hypothetical protein